MRLLRHALALVAFVFASPLAAQTSPVVVELYTSQGCSSCPPADALMHELAARDDVLALALHVDYWDYIGWKDPFADPAHAARQRAYATAGERRMIYTPEMVVGGVTDIVGTKPMALSKAIAEHASQPAAVGLDLRRDGNVLHIDAQALTAATEEMTVHLMRYMPKQTTQIKRGENRGKTLDYANIVQGWTVLGSWDGRTPLSLTRAIEGDDPVVVLIQNGDVGRIVAAARVR
ncbi:MAG: DUF1223 domain-containing protein [Pseudomonadota bacterium]